MIRYDKLHDKVVDTITSYASASFEYVNRDRWHDVNENFPVSNLNRFTVALNNKREYEESNSADEYILNVSVQFALDSTHDNYLKYIGYAEEAVKLLETVDYADLKILQSKGTWEVTVLDKIMNFNFEDINFIILT